MTRQTDTVHVVTSSFQIEEFNRLNEIYNLGFSCHMVLDWGIQRNLRSPPLQISKRAFASGEQMFLLISFGEWLCLL